MSNDYGLCEVAHQPDYIKDEDETIDYVFNWKPELNGDLIFTSTFVLPDGLSEVSSSNTSTTATIFLSGGSQGSTYRVTNRIVTIGGRTRDHTIYVLVQER